MGKITVLGGGGTGCCIAANLTLMGHQVTLYEKQEYWHENIDGILTRGGVEMTGGGLTGFAKINKITSDLAEALEDSRLTFVSMVAWRHRELAEALKPLLKAGDAVVFSAGNFGSILLKRTLGLDSGVLTGEMMGNILSCRMLGAGRAVCATPYAPKMVAAFPACEGEAFRARYSEILPCTEAVNVFEAALNAPNVVIHLTGSLLNTCAVEHNPDFALYREGLSGGVIRCQKAVEEEKRAIMDAMGYKMVIHTDHMERVSQYDKYPELEYFRNLKGPDGMHHRYIEEDATTGNAILMQLGQTLGIPTPTVNALIQLAGAVNHENYFERGLKLADLGIMGVTPEAINAYLLTGV